MADITFSELSAAANNCCIESNGKVLIDPSLLTGETIANLSDGGVLETLAKLMKSAYEAQEEKNELLQQGQKLGALSPPSSNVPALDGGKIITTTEYAMRLKYSVDLDRPSSPLS